MKEGCKTDWYKYFLCDESNLGEYEGFLGIVEECMKVLLNELYAVGD
jgi:hypothetical protein